MPEYKREGNDVIGRPGGFARARKLSAERRKEIAVRAARIRWKRAKTRIRIKIK